MKSVDTDDGGRTALVPADLRPELKGGVAPLHGGQDPVRAPLTGRCTWLTSRTRVGPDQPPAEFPRVGGGKRMRSSLRTRPVWRSAPPNRRSRRSRRAAIGVHVLAEQRDPLERLARPAAAASASTSSAGQCFPRRARTGHHAEGAVLAAAFHDGNERPRLPPFRGSGGWSELSRFRELMSTCGPVSRPASSNSGRRCRVCGPNTRSTNGRAVRSLALSRLATQPPTPMSRPGLAPLQAFDASQIVKHLFLGLSPHRAGVEQDDIGLCRLVGLLHALRRRSTSAILSRVVLVHLAAKGADE